MKPYPPRQRPCFLLILLSTLLPAGLSRAADAATPPQISAEDAWHHANEEATVCGFVAGAKYAENTHSRPTFLDFEKPYPGELFRVVIWGSDRDKFSKPPEKTYNQKRVCAIGTIKMFRGKPEIVVRNPSHLSVQPPA